jgi:hypothetical protein
MTMFFLVVTLGATEERGPAGVALFVGDWAVAQLWLLWLALIVGAIAIAGAMVHRVIGGRADRRGRTPDARRADQHSPTDGAQGRDARRRRFGMPVGSIAPQKVWATA